MAIGMGFGTVVSGLGSLLGVFGGGNERAIYEEQKRQSDLAAYIQNDYNQKGFISSVFSSIDQYEYNWDLSVNDYQRQVDIQKYEQLQQQKLYQKSLGITQSQLNLNDLAQNQAFAFEDFNLKNLMKQSMFSQESELIALQNAVVENKLNTRAANIALGEVGIQQNLLGIQRGELGLQRENLGISASQLGTRFDELAIQSKQLGLKEVDINIAKQALGIKKADLSISEKELDLERAKLGLTDKEIGLQKEQLGIQVQETKLQEEQLGISAEQGRIQQELLGFAGVDIELQKATLEREADFIGQESLLLDQKNAIAQQFIQDELTESKRAATFEKQGAYVETLNKQGTVLTQQSGKSRSKAEQVVLGDFFRGMAQLESTLTGQNRQAALRMKELQTQVSFDQAKLQYQRDKLGLQATGLDVSQQKLGRQMESQALEQQRLGIQAEALGLSQDQIALKAQGLTLNQQAVGLQGMGLSLDQQRLGMQGVGLGYEQAQLSNQLAGVTLQRQGVSLQGQQLGLQGQVIGIEGQQLDFAGQKLGVQGQQLGLEAQKVGLQQQRYDTELQNSIADATFNMKVIDAEVMQAAQQATFNKQNIAVQKFGADLNAVANMMIKPTKLPTIPPPTKPPEQTFIEPPLVLPGFVAPPTGNNVMTGIGKALGAAGQIATGFDMPQ